MLLKDRSFGLYDPNVVYQDLFKSHLSTSKPAKRLEKTQTFSISLPQTAISRFFKNRICNVFDDIIYSIQTPTEP